MFLSCPRVSLHPRRRQGKKGRKKGEKEDRGRPSFTPARETARRWEFVAILSSSHFRTKQKKEKKKRGRKSRGRFARCKTPVGRGRKPPPGSPPFTEKKKKKKKKRKKKRKKKEKKKKKNRASVNYCTTPTLRVGVGDKKKKEGRKKKRKRNPWCVSPTFLRPMPEKKNVVHDAVGGCSLSSSLTMLTLPFYCDREKNKRRRGKKRKTPKSVMYRSVCSRLLCRPVGSKNPGWVRVGFRFRGKKKGRRGKKKEKSKR